MAAPPTPRHAPEPHFKLDRMQKPAGPMPPWPRPGSRTPIRVANPAVAHTWGTVATGAGVPDVWDLIAWNFGTPGNPEPTPREVNWYMHHFIGCWRATADGKNFRFIEADPGWVHIPPLGWSRKVPGLPFHTTVALTISKLVPDYPVLNFAPYTVEARDLAHVRFALNEGLIGVEVKPGLSALAEYDIDDNVLLFRNTSTSSFTARLNIVHEATHAVLDRKFSGLDMKRWENELIAYTAEALWAWAVDPTAARALLDSSDASDSTKAAVVLAHYLRGTTATKKKVKEFDRMVEDFRDTSRSLNPVRNLKRAIRIDLIAHGQDPDDLLLMNGWVR
jgi:hypothetical protein